MSLFLLDKPTLRGSSHPTAAIRVAGMVPDSSLKPQHRAWMDAMSEVGGLGSLALYLQVEGDVLQWMRSTSSCGFGSIPWKTIQEGGQQISFGKSKARSRKAGGKYMKVQ